MLNLYKVDLIPNSIDSTEAEERISFRNLASLFFKSNVISTRVSSDPSFQYEET